MTACCVVSSYQSVKVTYHFMSLTLYIIESRPHSVGCVPAHKGQVNERVDFCFVWTVVKSFLCFSVTPENTRDNIAVYF